MGTFPRIDKACLADKWSCKREPSKQPKKLVVAVFPILMVTPVLFPTQFVSIILSILALCILILAALRFLGILVTINHPRPHTERPSPNPFEHWPKITVLVPLYKEAHMVPSLMHHLKQLNYPRSHLSILLIAEQDDKPTCEAINRLLDPPFDLFIVPPSLPRTKPKALNAALFSLPPDKRGDIITVYDAEDRPHPDQLKQAATALMNNPDLVAVQAPLGFYNDRQNWLTAMFALEYAALFHVWNPALARMGMVFTLGGTSNHIRYNALQTAGGWDPHNVTEDADLSFRLTALQGTGARKYKIGTIKSPTAEEAVCTPATWRLQRSRWLKGFMQTWLVHSKKHDQSPDNKPIRKRAYLKTLCSLYVTIGATLMTAFLHVPSLIIIGSLCLANYIGLVDIEWPASMAIIMISGYGAAILTAIIGAIRADKPYLIKYAPLLPFYWLMYFWPALIALREISHAPSLWHKTAHSGVTVNKEGTNTPYLEP